MNNTFLKFRHVSSYINCFLVSLNLLSIGSNLAANGTWKNFWIFLNLAFAIFFIYDMYRDVKKESQFLNIEFPNSLKNFFHYLMQAIFVCSFTAGYTVMVYKKVGFLAVVMTLIISLYCGFIWNLKVDNVLYKEKQK